MDATSTKRDAKTDPYPVRRALISVHDKSGLVELGRALVSRGIEILSTGGTAKILREANLNPREIAELTGIAEMMDGRVKTLHPAVHAGILGIRDNQAHMQALQDEGFSEIDLVIVNLYPFERIVEQGSDYNTCVENIDIGGPAMIRAAAKNHAFVTVVVDVDDYDDLLRELDEKNGGTGARFRQRLASIAYARTAAYDAAISQRLNAEIGETAPRRILTAGEHLANLRYGENPHQAASVYTKGASHRGIVNASQHQGKELSYNNYCDADAAFDLVSDFAENIGPVCAIIKHANPCGVASGSTLHEAFSRARDCDPVSAFGGVIAMNSTLDATTAAEIIQLFSEVVVVPAVTPEACAILAKKPNIRLLTTDANSSEGRNGRAWRQITGGFLVQDHDFCKVSPASMTVVTRRQPTASEMDDLLFAWVVAKHAKSNAIVFVRDGATIGLGAGQTSRVDSARIAILKARDGSRGADRLATDMKGSVVASDAFFPFTDGLMVVAEAGASAIIQPGGASRDAEIIEAADNAGLAMVFTHQRHFRH
ncbi:MAG: bifunctional phosphoribosylaminoimidazolecarboxamide formyltransferase/IMP cyclohydrolase [Aestuariivita sp.]|nr:bifunctional phosphoribosylaminoimidazolecarboxamide formyltransferase/IMP cyclohydrolase [Aestuariivita sp.]MCY4203298.1 bifunctional phosphoribosylaminoimidazolecarboxamide formyltransferase/IMP cyclohydrolase [Aestuariivita sp.]